MDKLLIPRAEKPKHVSKHRGRFVINEPVHDTKSSRQVQYNLPVFANLDRVIQAKPSHSVLKQSEVDKAGLLKAMYEQRTGRSSIPEYLKSNVPSYELVEQVSDNVMVVRNRNTGQNQVVVKGIDPYSVADHVDLQTKLWIGEPTKTYQDALRVARDYSANEIIGHSRGGSTAMAVAQELGVRSTGFNSVITSENVSNASHAPLQFKHTEFSNGADFIVNGINEITNPNAHGKYPENIKFKNFAGIQGENLVGQHDVTQWTSQNLERHSTIDLPFHELAFKSRHAGDLITAEMFAKGVREHKTYRQILNENEGGFGIVDAEGRFTSRNFEGNNMSELFKAVGGVHTESEIQEMRNHTTRQPQPHTLSDDELIGLQNGQGADMVNHALDNLSDTHARLPELPTTTFRTIGSGIFSGIVDSFKPTTLMEGLGAGIVGEVVATGIDKLIGKLPGEFGELQHSTESFGVAGLLTAGLEGGAYGALAGLASEGARYGTDELLKHMGASAGVRGNVDALVAGATAGAVLGSVGGVVGSVVGAGVGAVISETAHVITTYGDRIEHFFKNIF